MNQPDLIDPLLRRLPLFAWLSAESIAWFAHYAETHDLAQGDVLFPQGSPGDSLYVIVSGEITFISGQSEDTDEQSASTLEEGETFGELSLLETRPRLAMARAALPSRLLQIKSTLFREFAQKNQDQHAILFTNLARDLARKIRSLNAKKSSLHPA
ncbi:MAG: cyclic nucleotide-binding domain-containing protein [Blastochloris sp.]|nr:cyclic nucleotide-binding domain-containing protein [Blastochloris sp.]